MEPLMALVAVTALVVLVGVIRNNNLRRIPVALRGGLAAMFVMTGLAHFVGMRQDLVDMVPPLLPAPELLVSVTGVAEIVGAIALLSARTVLPASAALTALLLVMFPANVYYAIDGDSIPWHAELLPRTLLQVVYVAATSAVLRDRMRATARPAHDRAVLT